MSKRNRGPITSAPRKPRRGRRRWPAPAVCERPGVLAPQVEVALLAAGGVAGDGHGLEHGEGVALQQHPVLERARLGLVGVAHQLWGRTGWPATASHFRPVGKAAPPRPSSLEAFTSRDHAGRAQLHRPAQRRVAAVGPVVVEAGGSTTPDPAQQHERRVAALRDGGRHRGSVGRGGAPVERRGHVPRRRARRPRGAAARSRPPGPPGPARTTPGRGSSGATSARACPGPEQPRPVAGPGDPAGQVDAHVDHPARARAPARTGRRRSPPRRPRPAPPRGAGTISFRPPGLIQPAASLTACSAGSSRSRRRSRRRCARDRPSRAGRRRRRQPAAGPEHARPRTGSHVASSQDRPRSRPPPASRLDPHRGCRLELGRARLGVGWPRW